MLALGVGGCAAARDFSSGFTDEAWKQGANIAADAVEKKLGHDFSDLSGRIDALPKPQKRDPSSDTIWYGIGGLAAYILGSLGKGLLRSKFGPKGEDPKI